MVPSGQLPGRAKIQNPREAKPGAAILPAVQQMQAATVRQWEAQPSIGEEFSRTLYSMPRYPAADSIRMGSEAANVIDYLRFTIFDLSIFSVFFMSFVVR